MGDVVLETYNPYEDRFPGRRVITREQLHLAKLLRAQGVTVLYAGDPDAELNYLALKGLREWLADPIVAISVNVPLGILAGLIANALTGLVKGRAPKPTDVLIEVDEGGTRARYTAEGRRLGRPELRRLMRMMDKRYSIAHRNVTSSDPSRPVPIYLEHADKVVAWGRLAVDEIGLRVDDAKVTDDETWARIKSGELRGISIGALVRRAKCTVCGESYFDCPHLSGSSYDGVLCGVEIEDLDLGEVSLVANPANPLARVTKFE